MHSQQLLIFNLEAEHSTTKKDETMATFATTQEFSNPLIAFAQDKLEQFVEARKKARVYRTTLRELQNLSAREMADIGINPSNIRSIAYEAAYEA